MVFDKDLEKTTPIISITLPDERIGSLLLEGKFVGYHDSRYGVTSGFHQIVMKLLRHEDLFFLFYLHVPYAYPIPDGIKETIKSALEATLNNSIQKIEFINAGTEMEKKDIQFRLELGD